MFVPFALAKCLFQGVEPFKISLRFRFKTFQKFGFRFGSGSVAPKFKGSGSSKTKFLRFSFGSNLLSPNFIGSGSVRVHRKKAVFTGSGSGSL